MGPGLGLFFSSSLLARYSTHVATVCSRSNFPLEAPPFGTLITPPQLKDT